MPFYDTRVNMVLLLQPTHTNDSSLTLLILSLILVSYILITDRILIIAVRRVVPYEGFPRLVYILIDVRFNSLCAVAASHRGECHHCMSFGFNDSYTAAAVLP